MTIKIEPCTITTQTTREWKGWMHSADIAFGIGGNRVWDITDNGQDIPVTLTYPATVEVPGFRIEASEAELDNEIALLNAIRKARGSAPMVEHVIAPPAPAQPARVPYTYDTWPKGVTHVRYKNTELDSEVVWQFVAAAPHGINFTTFTTNDYSHVSYASAAKHLELSTDGGKTWRPCYQTDDKPADEWVPVSVRVPENIGDKVVRTDDGQEVWAWWDSDREWWRLYTGKGSSVVHENLPLTVTAWREIREGETPKWFTPHAQQAGGGE